MNMKRYITTGLLLAAFTAGMSACDDDVAEVVTPSLEVTKRLHRSLPSRPTAAGT